MLIHAFLDNSPVWLLYLFTVLWLSVACEIGYRFGRICEARWPESGKTASTTVMSSTLGLLAFILAFTFGMSSARFDARKQLVLEEASALLTTHKQIQLLAEPQRTLCTEILSEYIALRLKLANTDSYEDIQALVRDSERLQDELWAQGAILSQNPNMIVSGFIRSLATLSDYQIKRIRAAIWNRIPAMIVVALYGIAFLALLAMGFGAGLNKYRASIPALVLALTFASVIVLIIDLERPQQQLFNVSQEPMEDVARRIQIPAVP